MMCISYNGREFWEYEFDVMELAKTEDGAIWPEPWTTGKPSGYEDMHPVQLRQAWIDDVECNFFIKA